MRALLFQMTQGLLQYCRIKTVNDSGKWREQTTLGDENAVDSSRSKVMQL